MRHLLFIALLFVGKVCFGQGPITNYEGTANSIVSKLNAGLSFTDVQKEKVLTNVLDFLKLRGALLPLAESNPKAYEAKLKSLHTGFYRRMKAGMKEEQYGKFLEMKPKENDGTNVLTQLYY